METDLQKMHYFINWLKKALLFAEDQVITADSKIIHREKYSHYKTQQKILEWKYQLKNLRGCHFWTRPSKM
jgi:hypothetical protein